MQSPGEAPSCPVRINRSKTDKTAAGKLTCIRKVHFLYVRHYITTRISIQTAGLEFGGSGLCSYRARGVDGSCAKHLTVESYTVIYTANSHTYY